MSEKAKTTRDGSFGMRLVVFYGFVLLLSSCLDSAQSIADHEEEFVAVVGDTLAKDAIKPDASNSNQGSTRIPSNYDRDYIFVADFLGREFDGFSPRKPFSATYFYSNSAHGMPTPGLYPTSYSCTISVSFEGIDSIEDTAFGDFHEIRRCHVTSKNPIVDAGFGDSLVDTTCRVYFASDSVIPHQSSDWESRWVFFGPNTYSITESNRSGFLSISPPTGKTLIFRDSLADRMEYYLQPHTRYFLKNVGLIYANSIESATPSLRGGFRLNEYTLLKFNEVALNVDSILSVVEPL